MDSRRSRLVITTLCCQTVIDFLMVASHTVGDLVVLALLCVLAIVQTEKEKEKEKEKEV